MKYIFIALIVSLFVSWAALLALHPSDVLQEAADGYYFCERFDANGNCAKETK